MYVNLMYVCHLEREASLPELTPAQKNKLRHLSIISLASNLKVVINPFSTEGLLALFLMSSVMISTRLLTVWAISGIDCMIDETNILLSSLCNITRTNEEF